MTLSETLLAQAPPLKIDADGVVRVGGTRVTLESVIHAYLQGATPEEIVRAFDTLKLADVHDVISHYLRNRAEVQAYLAHSAEEADRVRRENEARFPADELRARMNARLGEGPKR